MSLESLISSIQVKSSELGILMKELRKQLIFKNFNKVNTPVLEGGFNMQMHRPQS